jgi:hypothetical protein
MDHRLAGRVRHFGRAAALLLVVTAISLIASGSAAAETIARLHWLGMKRIAAETNSASFMRIWNEPETARLESETLDKLSAAPWRLPGRQLPGATTNGASSVPNRNVQRSTSQWLRPLLDDLVQEESYFEMSKTTNGTAEMALAIHLNSSRSEAWRTNLAAALKSLTACDIATNEGRIWVLKKHHAPDLIEFDRVGDWTLLGAAQGRNNLLDALIARVRHDHRPYSAEPPNYWIDAAFDLRDCADTLGIHPNKPGILPRLAFQIIGEGGTILTRGSADFTRELPFELKPWRIPTNLVPALFSSFTAARGLAPLLKQTGLFNSAETVPDSLFAWTLFGIPSPLFVAAPVDNSASAFTTSASVLSAWINKSVPPSFGFASVDLTNRTMSWKGLSLAAPFLRTITNSGQQYLFCGTMPPTISRSHQMPEELTRHILAKPDLLYYDWELTGIRLLHWRYFDDMARIIFDERGTRFAPGSAALAWIDRNRTNLAECVTEVTVAAPRKLNFDRNSSVGLSAAELDVLANVVESSEFPDKLESLLITNSLPTVPKRKLLRNLHRTETNSVAK